LGRSGGREQQDSSCQDGNRVDSLPSHVSLIAGGGRVASRPELARPPIAGLYLFVPDLKYEPALRAGPTPLAAGAGQEQGCEQYEKRPPHRPSQTAPLTNDRTPRRTRNQQVNDTSMSLGDTEHLAVPCPLDLGARPMSGPLVMARSTRPSETAASPPSRPRGPPRSHASATPTARAPPRGARAARRRGRAF
jgi:hypothetical protein